MALVKLERRKNSHDGSASSSRTKSDLYLHLKRWIREASLADLGRGSTPVRVACALMYYAGHPESVRRYLLDGRAVAYPGQARLARELSVSQTAISTAIKKLESAKLISVRRSVGGSGETNEYRLLPQRHKSERKKTLNSGVKTPKLKGRKPPTDVNANNPSKEGVYKNARSSKHGAAPSRGDADAPQQSGIARPLFKPVNGTNHYGDKVVRWKRLSDSKVLLWQKLTPEERADIKRHYQENRNGTYRRRKTPLRQKTEHGAADQKKPRLSEYEVLLRKLPQTHPLSMLDLAADRYSSYKIDEDEFEVLRRKAMAALERLDD